ncbi:MAG TPA: zinc ribbon domain-containing protein [Sedimentisphaerales bacterium]|nr:zinc ribbon domain-containing protein [Sedimentisphaerales bacterium]
MPTYEYICESCGCEFERFQSITARPMRKCPDCGKSTLKRLVGTGSGIIFKGSGFYQTDYRSESYKEGQKSEKSSVDKDTVKKKTVDKSKDSKPTDKTKPDTKGKKKSP